MQGTCLIFKNSLKAFKSLLAFFRGNSLAQGLNNVGNFELFLIQYTTMGVKFVTLCKLSEPRY